MSTLTEARAVALKAAMDAQNAMNAAGDQVTYEMCKEVEKRVNEVKEIDERIAASKSARDMIASLAGNIPEDNTYEPGEDSGMKAGTFGERYVRSSTYSEWAKAHPSGLGEGSNLALPGVKIGDLEGSSSPVRPTVRCSLPRSRTSPRSATRWLTWSTAGP